MIQAKLDTIRQDEGIKIHTSIDRLFDTAFDEVSYPINMVKTEKVKDEVQALSKDNLLTIEEVDVLDWDDDRAVAARERESEDAQILADQHRRIFVSDSELE